MIEVAAIDHAVPADADRVQPIDQLAADAEDAGALGTEQPLVSVGRQEVDRRALHVERQDAQPLDGIDEEQHAALAAQLADRDQVVAEAAGILDETEADQPRAAVDGGAQIIEEKPAVAAGHAAQLDAAARRGSSTDRGWRDTRPPR